MKETFCVRATRMGLEGGFNLSHLLVKLLRNFPNKNGAISAMLLKKLKVASPSINIDEQHTAGNDQAACDEQAAQPQVEILGLVDKVASPIQSKRTVQGESDIEFPPKKQRRVPSEPCLTTSIVWARHRSEVRSWLRQGPFEHIKATLKQRHDESPEDAMGDVKVFDSIFTERFRKQHATVMAPLVVDRKFESGPLKWQGRKQRTNFQKRIREALLRWTAEWAGEVRRTLIGRPHRRTQLFAHAKTSSSASHESRKMRFGGSCSRTEI